MKKLHSVTLAVALTSVLAFSSSAFATTGMGTTSTTSGTGTTAGTIAGATPDTPSANRTDPNAAATRYYDTGAPGATARDTVSAANTYGTGAYGTTASADSTTYGSSSYNGTNTNPASGTASTVRNYGGNLLDRMSTTGIGTGTSNFNSTTRAGTHTGDYDTNSYRTYTTAANNRTDWGWLGLIGLLGLAGLRGRNRNRDDFGAK